MSTARASCRAMGMVARPRCPPAGVNHASRTCQSARRQSSSMREAQAIADAFLDKFSGGQTFTRFQVLDANQLRLFSLTLNRPYMWPGDEGRAGFKALDHEGVAEGTPLPPGYHLAYFTPPQLPGVLGVDGTDASFNPDAPFTRRMWAGGSVHWPGARENQHLKVGDYAMEVTKVLSCEPKIVKKTGETMLVVGVEKEFMNGTGDLCVVDRRNWVFREALDPSNPSPVPVKPPLCSAAELHDMGAGKIVQTFNRDVVILFRYSALTFNAHRIHYDKPWAMHVEGHRDVVVHGPMNLIAQLDMWRDAMAEQRGHGVKRAGGAGGADDEEDYIYPAEIAYRATSPVYAGEGYRIMMNADFAETGVADMRVVSDDGTLCMKGTIIT